MLAAIGSGEELPKPFAIDMLMIMMMVMVMMMVIVIVLKAREDARSDWIW